MSNSALVSYARISPNSSNPRNKPILKITPHHMAGNLTLEQFGSIVANPARQMSANYAAVSSGGNADYSSASYAALRAPICFRIA